MIRFKNIFFLLALLLFATSCYKDTDDDVYVNPEPESPEGLGIYNLALGNPSDAQHNSSMEENYLIEIPQYAISYSRSRGIPNWVSWYLNKDWTGDVERQNDFRANQSLPANWYWVEAGDYGYSSNGFSRGHNCPSADRTVTTTDNSSTFLMTNVIPQAPDHNESLWVALENYCRSLVWNQGKELYIIMGNYGTGGIGDAGYREKLASGKITVPRYIWKIVVVLPNGEDDIDRISDDTRVIAIMTENKNSAAEKNWGAYRVSVDEIEAATNYDFLSNIPENIQTIIEASVDNGPIQ
ncbi:MAG: hypothetical protein DHS20C18_17250 [Saprospiraceae bacterium]|nr:MAG: hypothetical protein DHS20C18_17250 [Saprospiraceae bacterium]